MNTKDNQTAMESFNQWLAEETRRLEQEEAEREARLNSHQAKMDEIVERQIVYRGVNIALFLIADKKVGATIKLKEAFGFVDEIRTPEIRESALQHVAQIYNRDREVFRNCGLNMG